jgi:hypothetical protein
MNPKQARKLDIFDFPGGGFIVMLFDYDPEVHGDMGAAWLVRGPQRRTGRTRPCRSKQGIAAV